MLTETTVCGGRQTCQVASHTNLRTYLRRATILIAVAGSASDCAMTAGRPSSQPSSESSSREAVSAADLSREGRNDTVLAALRRVRPEFFTMRGSTPLAVSIDGGPPEDVSILETMRVSTIEGVSVERGASSVAPRITTWGAVVVGEVLLVRTRRGTPRR
jgi:hypothetical protein